MIFLAPEITIKKGAVRIFPGKRLLTAPFYCAGEPAIQYD